MPLKGGADRKVRAVGQQPEGDSDQDVEEDELFREPFSALVKNCNMLQNIVGPACVFLKQGFSQTIVCSRAVLVHFHPSIVAVDPSPTHFLPSFTPTVSPQHRCRSAGRSAGRSADHFH